MALPSGIATTLLTFGPYEDPQGNVDASWSATVTLDRELFWPVGGGSYAVIEQINLVAKSAPDGTSSLRLPQTDQAGYIDASGSPITTGFSYGITWNTVGYSKRALTGQRLTAAMGTTVDADGLHQGVAPSAPANPTTYVNSITINGVTYTGNAILPDAVSGAGTTTVSGITNATAIGQALLLSADAPAALTALGISTLPTSVATLLTQMAALQAQVTALTTTVTTGLAGKVSTTSVGVTVAPLDSSAKLPLANLTPNVPLLIGDGSATVPVRLNTPNVNIFNDTTSPPTGGTTAGGSAAAAPIDIWWG